MKKVIVLLIALLVLGVFVIGCTIPEIDLSRKGPSGQAGRSNIGHLYLYEKDPTDWSVVEDGAWGKMKYNLSGEEFEFVFNGHGLEADTDYTLIYYPDPWPGTGLICLGSGTTNRGGNVNIKNSVEIDFLPIVLDENFPEGAKIWLVLTSDVSCENGMTGWNPSEYLFEEALIQFNEGEQNISDEFSFSANDISDPSATTNEDGYFDPATNTLTTDGNEVTNYYLHISEGSELVDGVYGLYLVEYAGEGDLTSYYSTKPEPWQTYLLDALDGINPFAYIKGGLGTPLLLDAAKFDLIILEDAMTIPGDYPEGNYSVAGKVETSEGWRAVTFVLEVTR